MAADDQESRVPLKLLVDNKKNRVIAAEANRDFVDILFSFLTFPIGTIIRLTNYGSSISTCMNNLYQSVDGLSVEHLDSENCKSDLLNPRNPSMEYCFNLKVNIDDSVSNKYYFRCSNRRCTSKSWSENVTCYCGGRTTTKEIFSDIKYPESRYGVFLQGGIGFIITDDLKVLPGSPTSLAQLFSDIGYSHMNHIKEMTVEVGKEEISRLLTCSMISKTPLTDTFLIKQVLVDHSIMPKPRTLPVFTNELNQTINCSKINLKLILSKSTNKILYAEAEDWFVDFLFSFLTFPIGSVMHVLNGVSGLRCVDNLYKSVEDLELKWFHFDERHILLNPGIAPRHKCRNLLPPIAVKLDDHSLLDPRNKFGGLTKVPSVFIVLDNLKVRPLSSASSFGILKELNVPLCDIEEQMICFGNPEARHLLQAALTGSSSALTLALSPFLNKQKQED